MRRLIGAAALAAALAWAGVAAGQQSEPYPVRPVRIVVAAAPGGNPDVLGRLLSQHLTEAFGKPFVIENAPGAGGIVAAKIVAGTPPDGHALLLADSGALAINVALTPNLSYSPLRDFTPITALATVPTVLLVPASLPVATLREFIALARSKPGAMSYGSAGAGSIHHLTMAIFAERAGIDLLHVPYRGGTALVNGLLTAEIQAGWSGIPNVVPLIESGQLRALCVSVLQRAQSLPDIPTCAEAGFPGFDVATMLGLLGSAGTPPEVVARLQAVIAKAMREPEMQKRMVTLGMDMREAGTAHYKQFMKDDIDAYAAAVQKLDLQIK